MDIGTRWGNIKVMLGVGGNTRVMLGLYGEIMDKKTETTIMGYGLGFRYLETYM